MTAINGYKSACNIHLRLKKFPCIAVAIVHCYTITSRINVTVFPQLTVLLNSGISEVCF
jgi:hypothetical protein